VTGATGFIGQRVAHALAAAGHEVICCVRDAQSAAIRLQGLTRIGADFTRDFDPAVWRPRLDGVEVVVNAVGILRENGSQTFEALHVKTPQALFAACVSAGVQKIVQVSALGADEGASSAYHRSKRDADEYLSGLPLHWVIVQPSLVFGPGGASATLFTTLAVLPAIPLPGIGNQRVQPVHVDDLVNAITALVETDALNARRVPAVGPTPVTMRELLDKLRAALGLRPAVFLSVPLSIVGMAAAMGNVFRRLLLDRETLAMLLRGNTGSAAAMQKLLGHAPRPVEQFIPPEYAKPIAAQARLNWLLPLLRASVAVVWIITGILSLGVYPVSESYLLLARVGITGALAPVFLYGAALLDFAFGIGIYVLKNRRWLWRAQMLLMLGYSVIIAIYLPEFWLHPFGPLLKNLPILAAILLLHELEER
jgi:uncharacterized protein YbjT (DUF2867 family)